MCGCVFVCVCVCVCLGVCVCVLRVYLHVCCVCVSMCVCVFACGLCVCMYMCHMFPKNNSAPYLKVWVTLEYLLFGEWFLPPTQAHKY